MVQEEGVEDDAETEEAQAEVGEWRVRLFRLGLETEREQVVNCEGVPASKMFLEPTDVIV